MKKIQKRIYLGLILAIFVVSTFVSIKNTEGFAPGGGGGGGNFTMTLYGYVKDSSGSKLSGAKVVLKELEWGISKTVYSSTTGYYSVTISVYSYIKFTLTVSKSGYNTFTLDYYSPGTYRRDVYLNSVGTHTFSCSGYVKDDHTGMGIDGATVRITYGVSGIDQTTTTNPSGYFSMSITTSLYVYCSIIASKSDYTTQTKSVYSSGIRTVNFDLIDTPHAFTVYGTVKNHKGEVVSDAKIRIYGGSVDATVYSNVNGDYSYTTTTTDDMLYDMTISKQYYDDKNTRVYSGGTRELDVDLIPDYELHIQWDYVFLYNHITFPFVFRDYY